MTPEEFSKLASLVSDGLILASGEGRVLAVNAKAANLLGISPSEASGLSLESLVENPADEVESFLRHCRRSGDEVAGALRSAGESEQERVRIFGRRLARTDGEEVTLLLRIPRDDIGINRFGVLSQKVDQLGRELTLRHAAEAELREQRDLAAFGRDVGRAVVEDASIDSILQSCAELMVEYLNAAFARIWLLPPGDSELELVASAGIYTHLDGAHSRIPVGAYKIGLIAETQQPHLTNAVVGDPRVHNQEWAEQEGMVAFAGYPLTIDNETRGVMALFARHPMSQNALLAMASVADIIALGIERKRIELTLQATARNLRLADQRKDEFLAMLAHELRNPLAPIRSGLELLEIQSGQDETLTLMQDQVQHMSRLVDDLLDVSRIMRGRIELQTERLRFEEIIDHSLRTVRPAIDVRRHSILVRRRDDPIWVEADRVRLGQVVTNLLGNAAKYTPEGGTVEIESFREGEEAVLVVRDNGVGIAPEFLPEVFELFTQADRGLARSEGGLGVGLTLVQRLLELHGGKIEADSEGLGRGSQFTLRLPVAATPTETATDPSLPRLRPVMNCRVLVVDDSVGSAKILQRLLEATGIENIEMAHDGLAALAAAEDFRPDVIFLDLGLPGLTGYEVAQRLRSDERFETTRLIALTGYGTAEDRRKTHEVGFDQHLVKPVGFDVLQQVLAENQSSTPPPAT